MPAEDLIIRLRFEEALAVLRAAGDGDGLRRLLRIAADFGRARVVFALQRELPAADRLDRATYRRFLTDRAFPQLPIGGDAERGFAVDETLAEEIAAELGVPARSLYAPCARWMRARGSRHIAKLYVFARLGGDDALARELEPEFNARAAHPRRALAARLGGAVTVLQEGDDDAYNPISAHIWRGEDGTVIKEHLRLAIDPTRVYGDSEEKETLEAAAGPHTVRLLGARALPPHEVLLLEDVPGVSLAGLALAPATALRIAAQLAAVLERLHARAVVYLDLKAANVLLDPARGPTLLDFGMARRLPPGAAAVATLPSTLAYVPPELPLAFRLGPPADVYQLGLLVRELLCGDAHADLGHPALARARDVCARLGARAPAERPSAAEARAALEGL